MHSTLQVAVCQPSTVVAVIVQVPSPTYVTNQDWLTTATAVLLLLHITFGLLASLGVIVAVNCSCSQAFIVMLFLSNVIQVTGINSISNSQLSVYPSNVTVIVTVHSQVGVTNQSTTVAILVSLLVHTKF